MPERMLPATSNPLPVGLLTLTAEPDHASRHAMPKDASIFQIQAFGAEA